MDEYNPLSLPFEKKGREVLHPLFQRGSRAQQAGDYLSAPRALILFMLRLYSSPGLKHFARELRHAMTDAECRLWACLRRKQIERVQFYRQRPTGSYVVDFYAPATAGAFTVIELIATEQRAAPRAGVAVPIGFGACP